MDELRSTIALKDKEIEAILTDLRISKHLITQLESENALLSFVELVFGRRA